MRIGHSILTFAAILFEGNVTTGSVAKGTGTEPRRAPAFPIAMLVLPVSLMALPSQVMSQPGPDTYVNIVPCRDPRQILR